MPSCSKQFTLNVLAPGKRAYWTFNETTGNWLDSYSGIVLPRHPVGNGVADWLSGSGKIGNGITQNTNSSTYTFQDPGVGPMNWNPGTSTGFSVWFWCRAKWASLLASSQLSVSFYPHVLFSLAQLDVDNATGNTKCRFLLNGTLESGVIVVNQSSSPLADDDWVFVCGTLSTTTGVLSLYHNMNGILQSFSRPVPPNTPFTDWSAADSIDVQIDGNLSSSQSGVVDEVGVLLDKPITLAQVTGLYNSGSGVTWPAVKSIVA